MILMTNVTPSKEHLNFLKKLRLKKRMILLWQIGLFIAFFLLWEFAAQLHWIDPFIFSSPSRAILSLCRMSSDSSLFHHLFVTFGEAIVGFLSGSLIDFLLSVFLWYFPSAEAVLDPYLVIINSLPKIALGPVIIVWVGAGFSSILTVTLLITVVCTLMGILSGFHHVDREMITLLSSFGANQSQIFFYCVLPASLTNMVSVLKINVGMTWVGVIVGEFLVSKAGLGYLIVYGGQVFRMDLVMGSVLILCFLSVLMYVCIARLERFILKKTT